MNAVDSGAAEEAAPLLFDIFSVIPKYTYEHPSGGMRHMDYNTCVERSIAFSLFGKDNVAFPAAGYHPHWDYIVAPPPRLVFKVEQKIKTTLRSKEDPFFIEIYRINRETPSGLLLSHSDVYLIVTEEYNKGIRVIKCRLVSTELLMHIGKSAIAQKQQNFPINPYEIPHVWVGDFAINQDGTWNLSKCTRRTNKLVTDVYEHMKLVRELTE